MILYTIYMVYFFDKFPIYNRKEKVLFCRNFCYNNRKRF